MSGSDNNTDTNTNSAVLPPLDDTPIKAVEDDLALKKPSLEEQPSDIISLQKETLQESQVLPPLEEEKKPVEEKTKVKEKIIIKEKKVKSGGGFRLPGCGCRSCSCFGCLILLLIIVSVVAILYFRPSVFWNPIKTFLNKGENPPIAAEMPTSIIKEQVKSEISADKQTEVSEKELQSLLREKLDSRSLSVDVEPNSLKIYSNIDKEDKPLWVIFEISQNINGKLEVTRVGFARINIPKFLRDFLTDNAFKALTLSGAKGDDDGVKLMNEILDTNEMDYSISKTRFDKDKVTIGSN